MSIIIPTRDRCETVKELLQSLSKLRGLESIQPEILIGDNNSKDGTWELLQTEAKQFPVPFYPMKISTPGKSAVLNEAIGVARGELLAFLDDDVVVEPGWLESVQRFFLSTSYQVAQGIIRLQSPEATDSDILSLLQRYRTVTNLEYSNGAQETRSLNGANFALYRNVFDQIGRFDERLGPGVSGTSEDIELAHRIRHAGTKIGYMRESIVYHKVERARLTEAYFKLHHRRQGRSRLLFHNPSIGRILCDLIRVSVQYGFYFLKRNERKKYRSKGRIYHYLEMLSVKCQRQQRTTIQGTGFTGKNRALL